MDLDDVDWCWLGFVVLLGMSQITGVGIPILRWTTERCYGIAHASSALSDVGA